jgi:hypothetical protein
MLELIYSPAWFYGKDTLIDLISAGVLLLIAAFSYRYYLVKPEQRNYLHLAFAFGLMAAAFGAKAVVHGFMNRFITTAQEGVLLVAPEQFHASPNYYALFLLYRFLLVFALYWLYTIYQSPSRMNLLLITYLLFISTFFTKDSYLVFHLTAFVLTFLITATYVYRYRETRNPVTLLIIVGFGLLMLSRLLFIFVGVSPLLYVLAEVVQLAAFIGLLASFVRTFYHGKKTITY